MKKLLSTALVLIMAITAILPANLISYSKDSKEKSSNKNIVSGEFNYGINYELNYDTGVFTVTGKGKAFSGLYRGERTEIDPDDYKEFRENIDGTKVTKVVFSEGITLICGNPVSGFKNLKEVTLPKSLKRILRDTFPSDLKIDTINYGGNSMEWNKIQIDNQDGSNDALKNVKKINFSSKVPVVQGAAVFKDEATKKVYCGDGVCILNYYTGVAEVYSKGTVEVGHPEYYLDNLFGIPLIYGPSLDNEYGVFPLINTIDIKSGATKIGDHFLCTHATSVTIPKSVKKMEAHDFDCFRTSLKDIYYGGTIVDWNNIKITNEYEDAHNLSGVKIHYSKKVSAKDLKYSLSKTSYVYDGKTHTPSVTVKDKYGRKLRKNTDYTVTIDKGRKSAGKYKVFIKFKGEYYGQKTMYFTIDPKPTSISKLTAGKKKFTVKWKKKTSQTTGYQIQYSTSSKFKNTKTVTVSKNKTTSKTISKLKARKKYYVRVRTYKTVKVNGKSTKIYSAWSKAKTVTTK